MEEMVRTVNLTKQYGNKVIVDRVSISVKKGEIYGFLGLNGAGKTTTIRALLGMSKPSSGGSVFVWSALGEWESRFVETSRLYGGSSLCLP
ncbi:ABC transporter [Paenibacillus sp. cl141a]|uniref:ATP-binding cassette domain-containing protein n=1 Tax=Paenibacillus sp. cl141a TaxID=1761877 RepID=UPI0008D2B80F|nr:ATP-binding cassette domain-containing protein [Paenibacillus sp. cl141a]SEL99587.1 ABC transporter [Paenibacillus sp. cl141a]